MAACRQNGLALQVVPEKLIAYEVCMVACRQHGCALSSVTEKLIAWCPCTACKQSYLGVLEGISKKLITYELCVAAFKQYGGALYHVPYTHYDVIKSSAWWRAARMAAHKSMFGGYKVWPLEMQGFG